MARKPNWSSTEINKLVEEVTPNIEVIKSKFTTSVTNERKTNVWQSITDKINSVSSSGRSFNEVKKKWQDLQSSVKKKEVARVSYQNQTGGGPKSSDELKPWELQVADTLPRASVHGIDGGIDTEINGKNVKAIVAKAKEMKDEIKQFLQKYKPHKKLPKIGDSILNEYFDTTKGITEDERDELTSYLCTFEEINLSVLDIPSMVHDTISFIMHHSDKKDSECVQTNESTGTVRNYISFGSPTVDREESPTPVDTSSDGLTKRPRSTEGSIQSGALDIGYDGPSQNGDGVKRPNSKRDSKQPMKKMKTAEDVHQIQYAVLEKQLEKHTLQIKLLEKLILKYENDDTLAILSVFEQ